MVTHCGTCYYDIWNKINMLVKLSTIEFTMMKLLAILSFKTGKTIIKDSILQGSHEQVELNIVSEFIQYTLYKHFISKRD